MIQTFYLNLFSLVKFELRGYFILFYKYNLLANPHLDAWHGARHFANSSYADEYYTTKQMYEEYGSYYFKDHPLGNRYWINTN